MRGSIALPSPGAKGHCGSGSGAAGGGAEASRFEPWLPCFLAVRPQAGSQLTGCSPVKQETTLILGSRLCHEGPGDRQQRADANVNTFFLSACCVQGTVPNALHMAETGAQETHSRHVKAVPIPVDFWELCTCLVFSERLSLPQGRGFGQHLPSVLLWAHSRSSLIK